MNRKLTFKKDLNYYFDILNLSYDVIKAIDIKVCKHEYSRSAITKRQRIFKVPVKHTYDDLIKVIEEIDREVSTPVINYMFTEYQKASYNFEVSGTVWLKDGGWLEVEEEYDTHQKYLNFYSNTIPEDLLNGTTCTFGETFTDVMLRS